MFDFFFLCVFRFSSCSFKCIVCLMWYRNAIQKSSCTTKEMNLCVIRQHSGTFIVYEGYLKKICEVFSHQLVLNWFCYCWWVICDPFYFCEGFMKLFFISGLMVQWSECSTGLKKQITPKETTQLFLTLLINLCFETRNLLFCYYSLSFYLKWWSDNLLTDSS